MRKGLVSFIIILCMLIPLAVGCQNNAAGSTTPTLADPLLQATESATNAAQPELTKPDTIGSNVTEPQEAESSTPAAILDPTQPPANESQVTEEPEPAETTSTPTESQPSVTEPTAPIVTEPASTEPATTEPNITEPDVTEPPVTEEPTEVPSTEPTEVLDLEALVQYGRNYAANTHGYEISPGVRDGYYPAYTCVFDTMEKGRAAVRGCIDDTTRALLARPGNHIVVEIDGVICRARIDIAIVPKDEGTYLVSVYYG